MAKEVEHLPSKHEVLNWNCSTNKKKKKKTRKLFKDLRMKSCWINNYTKQYLYWDTDFYLKIRQNANLLWFSWKLYRSSIITI
jgi:hypothetical protein